MNATVAAGTVMVKSENVEEQQHPTAGQGIGQNHTHVVSPESVPSVSLKRGLNVYDDDTVVHSMNDEKNEECQQVKRRRLDPSLEAKLQRTDFWSVNQNHIQFTEQAFVNKAIFHLNSFISFSDDGKKRMNEGFSEFIREGIAAPGVEPLPTTLDIEKIADWTCSELTDTLTTLNNSDWDASKTAKWLKNATVGSFIIMRHEYPKCPFCPKRLIVDGKYIGPIYVIGIITKKVIPWSEEEWDIAENKLGGFSGSRWPISTVCKVSWKRMGYKKSLEKTTRDYINHVCQPSFQQICEDPEKVFAGGATSESVRRDLWSKAIIPISSNEFPDKFIHEGIPVWEEEQ